MLFYDFSNFFDRYFIYTKKYINIYFWTKLNMAFHDSWPGVKFTHDDISEEFGGIGGGCLIKRFRTVVSSQAEGIFKTLSNI